MVEIDYFVVGHISHDLTPDGYNVGGTVSYAGYTAHTLGVKTGILTSTAVSETALYPFPNSIHIHAIPAKATTTFKNIYTTQGRQQTIHAVAHPISTSDYPPDWFEPAIVHLGPVANEVDSEFVRRFPNSIIGLTPQGWMRRWDENGRVYAQAWEAAAEILPLATAVIISTEDLLDDQMLEQFRSWANLLVLTHGAEGCTIFHKEGGVCHIPAPTVIEVEPTGAGDIFAAAFLVRYHQTHGDYCEAGHFANQVASQSVTQSGLTAKMACIQQHLQELEQQ
ncbi:MAG: hypothetical protein KC419_19305 [Anaerolineales bacterium]|nr:hypothetical protein [Anaerolineales bacterium]